MKLEEKYLFSGENDGFVGLKKYYPYQSHTFNKVVVTQHKFIVILQRI